MTSNLGNAPVCLMIWWVGHAVVERSLAAIVDTVEEMNNKVWGNKVRALGVLSVLEAKTASFWRIIGQVIEDKGDVRHFSFNSSLFTYHEWGGLERAPSSFLFLFFKGKERGSWRQGVLGGKVWGEKSATVWRLACFPHLLFQAFPPKAPCFLLWPLDNEVFFLGICLKLEGSIGAIRFFLRKRKSHIGRGEIDWWKVRSLSYSRFLAWSRGSSMVGGERARGQWKKATPSFQYYSCESENLEMPKSNVVMMLNKSEMSQPHFRHPWACPKDLRKPKDAEEGLESFSWREKNL